MAGFRTCDHESQVQRPNHYTTEPPVLCWYGKKVLVWQAVPYRPISSRVCVVICGQDRETICLLMSAEETTILLKNGSEIKLGGATGAFESEFLYMETILEEVRKIIAGSNVSLEGLENLMEKLQQLRYVNNNNNKTAFV